MIFALAQTLISRSDAGDCISGFIPSAPLHRGEDSAFDPYDNFNLLTKSMRQLTKFADRIASTMNDPAQESVDRKLNHSSIETKVGRLSYHGNNVELKLRPRIDWQETREGFVLTAATPGLRKEELAIEIIEASGVYFLEISGQSAGSSGDSAKPLTLRASYQNFHHKVRLPAGVDRDSLKAVYENGLLVVTIQHSEKPTSQRHKITIS